MYLLEFSVLGLQILCRPKIKGAPVPARLSKLMICVSENLDPFMRTPWSKCTPKAISYWYRCSGGKLTKRGGTDDAGILASFSHLCTPPVLKEPLLSATASTGKRSRSRDTLVTMIALVVGKTPLKAENANEDTSRYPRSQPFISH